MSKTKAEFKVEGGKVLVSYREPLERVDKGQCYYCGLSVYIAQGQLYKTLSVNGVPYPTHKACRKRG